MFSKTLCLLWLLQLEFVVAAVPCREVLRNILNFAYEEAQKGERVLIVQGCNCFGFGGGLSKQIKDYLSEAMRVDQKTQRGDRSKLGNYSSVDVVRNGVTFKIVNAYTQYYGGQETQFNLETNIKNVFEKIADDFPDYKIYYPAIGGGIAGGDWEKIHHIIKKSLKGRDYTFVEFDPSEKIQLPRSDMSLENEGAPNSNESISASHGSVYDYLVPTAISFVNKKMLALRRRSV